MCWHLCFYILDRDSCANSCAIYIALNDSKATIFMKGVVPWKQCTASSMRYYNDYEIVNSWFIVYSQPNIAMDNWFLQPSTLKCVANPEQSRDQDSEKAGHLACP